MKVLSIVNHKGGVGKTTLALVLGKLLSESVRVLLIDLDPQANLTLALTRQRSREIPQSYHLLMGEPVEPLKLSESLSLIPSSVLLSLAEKRLANEKDKELRLSQNLNKYSDYQIVIIDTPPNLSLPTLNAVVASDGVIVPLQLQYFAVAGLETIFELLKVVAQSYDKGIDVWLAPNAYEKRIAIQRDLLEQIQKRAQVPILPSIPKRSAFMSISMDGDISYLDKDVRSILNQYTEEVLAWLKRDQTQ
jgi:ATPases involved in chromosome partitioning